MNSGISTALIIEIRQIRSKVQSWTFSYKNQYAAQLPGEMVVLPMGRVVAIQW